MPLVVYLCTAYIETWQTIPGNAKQVTVVDCWKQSSPIREGRGKGGKVGKREDKEEREGREEEREGGKGGKERGEGREGR